MENIHENIKKRIIAIFIEKGFVDIRVECEELVNKGEGLVGLLLSAKITGIKNNILHKFDAVVKIAPKDEDFRKTTPVKNLFKREISFYTKIVPIYEALQDEFELCVPKQMRCVLPRCIAACAEFRKEILMIENLTSKGYMMRPLEQLDYNHAALILRAIGKLHALSFIYKDRYPKGFNEMVKIFTKNCLLNPCDEFCESGWRKHAEYALKQFTESIADEELKNRCLKVFKDDLITVYKGFFRPSEINVILHGDTWSNNFMFKYKHNKPVKAVPLDFQWSNYASIAYDCMYLFGGPGAQEVRRNYFKELIDEYYTAFKDFLLLCGYDADNFCTYDDFLAEVKRVSLLSICICVITLPFMEFPNIPLNKLLANASVVYSKTTDTYKSVANGIIKDWADYGFI